MKNGKYSKNKGFNVRSLVLMLAVTLLICATIGGTIAWLTDTTDEVENTFTVGNIDIDLTETKDDFKMIPGWTIDKDPIVTVKANSEDCWVFVKVNEEPVSFVRQAEDGTTTQVVYNLTDFIDYEIDPNNWTQLKDKNGNDVEGVYVQTIPAKNVTSDRTIKVLLNNQVKVKETVTKQMMDDLEAYDVNPKLTFTAYAVQLYKSNGVEFTPAEAWEKISSGT